MMGEEWPFTVSGDFHAMFCVGDQASGMLVSVELPSPRGPRHDGQFSAWSVGKNAQKQANTTFMVLPRLDRDDHFLPYPTQQGKRKASQQLPNMYSGTAMRKKETVH
jgi:hypothetical protein